MVVKIQLWLHEIFSSFTVHLWFNSLSFYGLAKWTSSPGWNSQDSHNSKFCLQRSLHFTVHRGVYILVSILEWSLDLIYEVFSLWNRKSTIPSCMKYCCRVRFDVPNYYLYMWNRLQKRVRRTGPALAASLEPLVHRREWPSWVFSIGTNLVDVCQNWLK